MTGVRQPPSLPASLRACPPTGRPARRRAPRSTRPCVPSRRGSARLAHATRSRARSSCSARSWARSSRSRRARTSSRLVERVRRLTIDLRRTGRSVHRRDLRALLELLSEDRIEHLIRAFSLYFHLTNLAEEKQRVRRLQKRARTATRSGLEGSIDAAVRALMRETRDVSAMARSLSIGLVLTAHPTEARRRTLLVALRRAFRLLDRLDDPRLTPAEDADIRRRLREEIALLWRTAALRVERPAPLDEVRTMLVFFDESLFVVTPRLYRALDSALDRGTTTAGPARDSGRTGTRPPHVDAYLRWGSWIGADRDGHPRVTAQTTRDAAAIGADHVLRGYQAVATRLMLTVATAEPPGTGPHPLDARLERDREQLGDAYAELARRFPNEPYRRRFGSIAERLRRTRLRVVDGRDDAGTGYTRPDELLAELDEIRDALVAERMERVAYGELLDLRGSSRHSASMRSRSRSVSTAPSMPRRSARDARARATAEVAADGVAVDEVLETFRAMADIQARYGPEACHRYVISFTRSGRRTCSMC